MTEEDDVGKPMSSVGMSAASAIDGIGANTVPTPESCVSTVVHVGCLEIEL